VHKHEAKKEDKKAGAAAHGGPVEKAGEPPSPEVTGDSRGKVIPSPSGELAGMGIQPEFGHGGDTTGKGALVVDFLDSPG